MPYSFQTSPRSSASKALDRGKPIANLHRVVTTAKGVGEEMSLRKNLFAVLGTILACGMIAFAQEPQPQTSPTHDGAFEKGRIEGQERHRERMGRREGMRGRRGMARRGGRGQLLRELNLSEEQRQQGRAIMRRRLEGTKSQREELFKLREKRIAGTFDAGDEARAKALHQEIRTAMQGGRTEMAGLLTAEQKAKLETLKQERKARMEQRMKQRQERLDNKPQ
jgi:Spy/CpxP family protein refolding chaperone